MRRDRYEIPRHIIEGKIHGKISLRKKSYLNDLRCSSINIYRATVSKITLANWIANLPHSETSD